MRFYYYLYTTLAILAFIMALPYMLIRMIFTGRYRETFGQMLGFWPKEAEENLGGQGCIWIHAVSVGEAVAASAIIKELKRINPQEKILVSTVTETGQRMAKKIIPEADAFIYFPLDFPWLVRKSLKLFQPKIFAMVETELWPNFLRQSKKMGVINLMVNGRISDKSLRRYRYLDKLFSGIFKDMLSKLEFFSMQSDIDGKHILALGADPKKVLVTGNTKFDQSYGYLSQEEKEHILQELGLSVEQPIFVVGSTHKGEEEHILESFRKIKETYSDYVMILAPRHLDRIGEVEGICRQYGFTSARRTRLPKGQEKIKDIILLDTIGELGKFYGLGEIVYVGGSLVATGGHNLLEPAAQGKPTFFGPYMDNFKETTQLVLDHQAGVQVKDGESLTREILNYLQDPARLKKMGQSAWKMVEENKGASRKNAEIINSFLTKRRRKGSWRKGSKLEEYLIDVIMNKRKGLLESLLLIIFSSLSYLYEGIITFLLWSYRIRLRKRFRLPGKVISIGNITVGGTGKTPTTKMLAETLQSWGVKVAILNRGYRSKYQGEMALVSDGHQLLLTSAEAGDEAYMLAQSLPGIPVLIGKDRVATGNYALNNLGVKVVILDDGYQYWHLERDLNIVLIDVSNPFSNGRILPRGLMREPVRNLNRADVFLLSKTNYATAKEKEEVRQVLAKVNPQAPILEVAYSPDYLREFKSGEVSRNFLMLKGKKVLVVSGLSNPQFFEKMIEDWGIDQIEKIRFPDHYNYSLEDLDEIGEAFREKSLDLVVTTEKDAVSIPSEWQANFPLWVLGIEIKLEEVEEKKLKELIQEKLDQPRRSDYESNRDHSSPLSVNPPAGQAPGSN